MLVKRKKNENIYLNIAWISFAKGWYVAVCFKYYPNCSKEGIYKPSKHYLLCLLSPLVKWWGGGGVLLNFYKSFEICQCIFTSDCHLPLEKGISFIWPLTNLNPLHWFSIRSLIELFQKLLMHFNYLVNVSPWRRQWYFILNEYECLSAEDILCQV